MSGDPALLQLCGELAGRGYVVAPAFLDPIACADLAARVLLREATGDFRAAATGAGAQRAVRPSIRGDLIHWLSEPDPIIEAPLLERFERLRLALNEQLGLGLFDLECHYAIYPPGAHYCRHLDRSPAGSERVVSMILYLNEAWQPGDGGELRLYAEAGQTIEPRGGTLVLFMSERFEHEVLATRTERLSLTGWYRRRALGLA